MLKKNIITYIILGCLIFTGCSGKSATEDDAAQEPVSKEVFAMDTYMLMKLRDLMHCYLQEIKIVKYLL